MRLQFVYYVQFWYNSKEQVYSEKFHIFTWAESRASSEPNCSREPNFFPKVCTLSLKNKRWPQKSQYWCLLFFPKFYTLASLIFALVKIPYVVVVI